MATFSRPPRQANSTFSSQWIKVWNTSKTYPADRLPSSFSLRSGTVCVTSCNLSPPALHISNPFDRVRSRALRRPGLGSAILRESPKRLPGTGFQEVIEGTGVCNKRPHLCAEAGESFQIALKVFIAIFEIDAAILKKGVYSHGGARRLSLPPRPWASRKHRGGGICGRGRRSRGTTRVRRNRRRGRHGRRRGSKQGRAGEGRRGLPGSSGAWASGIEICRFGWC